MRTKTFNGKKYGCTVVAGVVIAVITLLILTLTFF